MSVVYPREWGDSNITLRLSNTKTGASFEINNLSPTATVMCSYQTATRFNIPDTMLNGQYSVTATVEHYIDGKATVTSEKFGQIITVGN